MLKESWKNIYKEAALVADILGDSLVGNDQGKVYIDKILSINYQKHDGRIFIFANSGKVFETKKSSFGNQKLVSITRMQNWESHLKQLAQSAKEINSIENPQT